MFLKAKIFLHICEIDLGHAREEADEFFMAPHLAVDLKAAPGAGAIKGPTVPGRPLPRPR